ncbi:hypothetical protein BOTBODRAFT_43692 [Botryobasidium botryosum FD-172 SS1]|uniref:Uncharacterized protein n=1 Tax=Botryobasidium botryosum (strain FD-172 SS1) TaxID=930990 RepID=A0A067MX27_BOTB1|nr:hypothetical protein BOTBODRAFT_43692 [Botryobasidium botryosum FD-172 SS1]
MSGIPPNVSAAVQPGTPSDEWAAQTTSALGREDPAPAVSNPIPAHPATAALASEPLKPAEPVRAVDPLHNAVLADVDTAAFASHNPPGGTTHRPPLHEQVSTPGHEFPGAFPRDLAGAIANVDLQPVTNAASTAYQSVSGAAATYVPQLVNTVTTYLGGDSNTTTTASERDTLHAHSLPSKEIMGARPGEAVGGAGSLPGYVYEPGVAKLPDQREPSEQWHTTQGFQKEAAERAAVAAAAASATYDAVAPHANTAANAAQNAGAAAYNAAGNAGNAAYNTAGNAGNAVVNTAGTTASTVGNAGNAAANTVGNAASSTYNTATSLPGAAANTVSNAASSTYNTATSLPGAAASAVQNAASSAYNSAAGMLGMGVAGATHNHELPSTETSGAMPYVHSDGVGPLPGSLHETGVAILPDERHATDKSATGATSAHTGTNPRLHGAQGHLPSSDVDGGNENLRGANAVGGVGSLIGGRGEEGVAVLPHAREVEDQKLRGSLPSRETSGNEDVTGPSGGVGSLIGGKDEEGVAVLPHEKNAPAPSAPTTSHVLPTLERGGNEGSKGPVGGVGSLVGGKDEEGVAVLPHEKQPTTSQKEPTTSGPVTGSASSDVKHVKPAASESETKSDAKQAAKDTVKGRGGEPNKGEGYDTDYHPAAMHPDAVKHQDTPPTEATGAPLPSNGSAAPTAPAPPPKDGHAGNGHAGNGHSKSPSAGDDDDDEPKKVGFMTKMKGNAKVLLGKVEGKRGVDKVEEGRKMKAGVV